MDSAETALAKITALLESMADDLTNNPSKVRFMAQFDAMYARHWPAERLISLEAQVSPGGFQYFATLIREGIADGSLRPGSGPGSYDACRDQRCYRSAAAARVIRNPSGTRVRAAGGPPVPRDDSRNPAGSAG